MTTTNQEPDPCLEHIMVYELVHLLERHHNERFRVLIESPSPPGDYYAKS